MRVTETEQTASTGAGEPENILLQAVVTPLKRFRKQAAAHTEVASKGKNPKPADTKTDTVLKKLRLAKGITIEGLIEATGWQPRSVRGFLSGTVKKKLGLPLVS